MTTQTLLDMEAEQLGYEADWREQKAAEYPDDERNTAAAKLLSRLATEVSALKGDPIEAEYEAVIGCGWVDESGEMSTYRSRIGFDNFPETGKEYIQALIQMLIHQRVRHHFGV